MMSTILAKIYYNERQEFLALIDRKFSVSGDKLTKESKPSTLKPATDFIVAG